MAGDRVLKSLRRNEAWERVVRATPHAAHWIDAEPLHFVAPMAGVLDRYPRFVIEGQPVVTGMVAVGDAWACTNPTAGRGASLGLAHAVALRDAARENGHAPTVLATSFDQITEQDLTPWYRQQVAQDYQWAADIQAVIDGRRPAITDDPAKKMQAALSAAANHDPDVARALLDVQSCIALPAEVMARPGILDKLQPFMATPKAEVPGPTRTELVALLQ
jgi:flavin-dependent dehydrogenase